MEKLNIEELKSMSLQELDELYEVLLKEGVENAYIQDVEVVINDKLDQF